MTGCWYVVQTKPHKEAVALENLQRQSYEAYCPHIVEARRKNQRWQKVAAPMFPRYLFVKLKAGVDNFSPIRSTLGVLRIVEFGFTPASISDQVISQIRRQEALVFDKSQSHPHWQPGESVEIVDGPFSGLRGIFEAQNGEERVIILLQMLGSSNRITLPMNAVVPA